MKKVSLAALVASSLMLTTPAAHANGTVHGHAKATPATSAATAASSASAPAMSSGAMNSPTAELVARPGNRRSVFELDLMIPVYQLMDRMLFVDLRGMLDTKRNKEINAGLGYRQIINNQFVLGVYGFGDWRRTRNSNNFAQLTLGIEALSNFVDARANVYIPDNKKKSVRGTDTARYTDGFKIERFGNVEAALRGFDGEVGVRIPMPGMHSVETRVFAGGYHFSRSGFKTMAGPRGRLEVRILDVINPGSRLTLGVNVSNDKVQKTAVYGVIGLRIPMQFTSGGKTPQGLQRRLGDYVYRDIDINTNSETQSRGFLKDDRGNELTTRFVSDSAGANGNGTKNNPYADPAKAEADLANVRGGVVVFMTGKGNSPTVIAMPTATTNIGVDANDRQYRTAGTLFVTGDDGALLSIPNPGNGFPVISNNNAPALWTITNNASLRMNDFTVNGTGTGGIVLGSFDANAKNSVVEVADMEINTTGTIANDLFRLQATAANTSPVVFSGSRVDANGFTNFSVFALNAVGGGNIRGVTEGGTLTAGAGNNSSFMTTNTGAPGQAGTMDVTINNPTVKNSGGAFVVADISNHATTKGNTKIRVNKGTISNANAGLTMTRSIGGVMSNTVIDANVTGTIFEGGAASINGDVAMDGDFGAGGTNVPGQTPGGGTTAATINVSGTTHKHTNIGSVVFVTGMQQGAGGNGSSVLFKVDNVTANNTVPGGSAILVAGDAGAPGAQRAIMFDFTKSSFIGYTAAAGTLDIDATIFTAGAKALVAGAIEVKMTGGGNSFGVTGEAGNSITRLNFGGTETTGILFNANGTAANSAAAAAGASPFGAQAPKPIV